MKNCIKCGYQMDDTAMFCMNCGTKADQILPQSQVETANEPVNEPANTDVFNVQPQADVFSTQPQEEAVNVQPQADVFSTQPQEEAVNIQPQADVFSAQPQEETVNVQPQADVFSTQPQEEAVNIQPQADIFSAGVQNAATDGQMPPKKSKKPIIIGSIIAGVVAIAAIVVVLLFVLNGNEEIYLNKYITVSVEGTDGYGSATVSFDYEKLSEELADIYDIDLENAKKSNKDYKSIIQIMDKLSSKMELTPTYFSELSNGDELEVEFKISDKVKEAIADLGIDINDEEYVFEVSDLNEIEKINPFDDIEVSIGGIYPCIDVNIDNNSENEVVRSIYFYVDTITENEVIVTYDYYGNAAEQGVELTETECSYSIEHLGTYVYTADDLSDDVLEDHIKYGEKIFDEWYKDEYFYSDDLYKDLTYKGFVVKQPDEIGEYNVPNVYIVYSATLYREAEEEETQQSESEKENNTKYFAFPIYNLYKDESGAFEVEEQDYEDYFYVYDTMEDFYSINSDYYGDYELVASNDDLEKLMSGENEDTDIEEDTTKDATEESTEEETTVAEEETVDFSEYDSLEDFVNSDELKAELDEAREMLESSYIEVDATADGNNLKYTYKYTTISKSEDEASFNTVKETLEDGLPAISEAYVELAAQLSTAFDEEIGVTLEYVDSEGNVLVTETYYAK